MQNDSCVFCNTAQSGEFLYRTTDTKGNIYQIRRCKKCLAYYLSPKPSPDRLAEAYDESYYGETEEKFRFSFIEKVLDYFRKGRSRNIARHLVDGARVIDIGCGNGNFLKFLSQMGDFELCGTELDCKSAERASHKHGFRLIKGKLQEQIFSEGYFDCITMFHVFEHSEEPKHFIDIMDAYGFKVISEKYLSFEQNPFGMIQSILNLMCKKREVLFEYLKGNTDYVKGYSGFNIFMQKLFMAITFPVFMVLDMAEGLFKKSATVEFVFIKK